MPKKLALTKVSAKPAPVVAPLLADVRGLIFAAGEKAFARVRGRGPRLRAHPSTFRWEDQFHLSLDSVTVRDSRAVGMARDFRGATARRARMPGGRPSQFHDETLPQAGAKVYAKA